MNTEQTKRIITFKALPTLHGDYVSILAHVDYEQDLVFIGKYEIGGEDNTLTEDAELHAGYYRLPLAFENIKEALDWKREKIREANEQNHDYETMDSHYIAISNAFIMKRTVYNKVFSMSVEERRRELGSKYLSANPSSPCYIFN